MRNKKIIFSSVIVLMFVSIIALAATLYPYAVVTFSGVEMVTNGSASQGFVDVTLKNVNTTGLSFCLSYDTDYIVLSSVDDNEPITNSVSDMAGDGNFNIEHKYFEQNTDAFPEGAFMDVPLPSMIGVNAPIIGIADADSGYVMMNFLPNPNGDTSDYIGYDEKDDFERMAIIANMSGGVKLGRLSFLIKNPSEFAKLTPNELKEIIKIVPFSDMMDVDDAEDIEDTGIYISYLDDDGIVQWYSREDKNIDYEFNIQAKLSDVQLDLEELTVSSYEIYGDGTVQDLLDYINEKASKLILSYSDGSKVPAILEWSLTESDISDIAWNPKGGEYVVTQKYNDDFEVSVTVNVVPIKLVDIITENQEKTYYVGDEDFPTTFKELELPSVAQPVLDTYIPNGGIGDIDIEWYQLEGTTSGIDDLPEKFDMGGTFKFICHINASDVDFETNYPWLTVPTSLPEVKAVRNVVTSEDEMPKTLVVDSAVTDIDGTLTIVVSNSDDSEIPDGTVFDIKMPGGETIDTAFYEAAMADGKGTITMNPDFAVENERKLAQLINLGNRAGNFAIASTEPGECKGEYTIFAPNPRRNTYLPASGGGNYEFDYSGALSSLFPVKAGTNLPTTITLPISSDRIETLYDGYYGNETGQLITFTVDDWTVTGDADTVGSIVTATGRLADTEYTNYGEVFNDNNYYVTIKYLVIENDSEDSIQDIADFVYDTQQVGYGYEKLQTQTFTLKNTGLSTLYGLSVNISFSADTNREAFILTKDVKEIVESGKSVDFDITTKIGLPVGEYVSTVQIISNNKVIDTFKLMFTVTEEPVYSIVVKVNDEELGTAKTKSELYTSVAGETIEIIAEPEEDCGFVGWECEEIEFADADATETTFEMPERDVVIVANFEETLGAKLRTTELYIKDFDDDKLPTDGYEGYDLRDNEWIKVTFDPVTREYYVIVPNDAEKVKLWFKLRDEAQDASIILKNNYGDKTDNIDVNLDSDDLYYKSDEIALEISPTENLVTLSLTKEDLVNFPDDGKVTREYKLRIYRKIKTSDLMKFNYGNSPYGLIMRDDSIVDKDASKQSFIDNGNSFTVGNLPKGATADVVYLENAWTGVNYDFDYSALFVVNNSSFVDSGYSSVTNSIGETVTDVSRSIEVNLLAETTETLQNGSSDDFVYIKSEQIELSNDTDEVTELLDKRIRPDIYSLKYSFTDFDGSVITLAKPIIILPTVGDINVSTKVDAEDVSRVLNRFSTEIANNHNVPDYGTGGALFKFRVCDVNCDGNLNAVDANNIRASTFKPFYINLTKGGDG